MFRRIISLILSISMMFSSFFSFSNLSAKELRILVPEKWEMGVGDSRILDCVFKDKEHTGAITWSASPDEVAVVDDQGRITVTGIGQATVTAKSGSLNDTVTLHATATPTIIAERKAIQHYENGEVAQFNNLQKIVTRYAKGDSNVPADVSSVSDYTGFQSAITADGAVWTITDYGVLRTDDKAPTQRDREQRFMGDRYFFSADTTDGKVLAICSDGDNGIWTTMQNGYTHIAMVEMDGTQKAEIMSDTTQTNVARRGMVSQATYQNNAWRTYDDDNDGLWTSMYGAGELMRYASLRDDPNASDTQIEQARQIATRSAEAVLMLHYISMRTGTTQAYVRRQVNGDYPWDTEDRWLSADALEKGGNGAMVVPSKSPADRFNSAYLRYTFTGSDKTLLNEGYYAPVDPGVWSNPADNANAGTEYEKQNRLLKGFVARTYSLRDENNGVYGNIYWRVNADKTATGVSDKPETASSYLINHENLRGVIVDASGEVPQRLWDGLIGSGYTAEDIIYKGDTSADELIGHMFIFKLIDDILAPEDPELKELLVTAADNLAQHIVHNGYRLVDGSGQPATWSNFSRQAFSSSSAVGLAPLHALVALSIFKVAAYVTGYEKWENEYRFLALDPAYEYAEVAAQYSERVQAAVAYALGKEASPYISTAINLLSYSGIVETLRRLAQNYSDEEMAMLAFYVMFQLEEDGRLLYYYRAALEDWWVSIQYSENPLWYYIYQLAYPNKTVKDAYGNDVLKTAAWSLSRHPVDTICYLASNNKRDDIASLDLSSLNIDDSTTLSFSLKGGVTPPELPAESEPTDVLQYLYSITRLQWSVAAPDERALHKYNNNSYWLDTDYSPDKMEGSTTYTLPYWFGVYHGMLK